MKISAFKNRLQEVENVTIQLPNGSTIPAHFHITEMGLQTKHFIDCGNTIREEKHITFQLWLAADLYHRLAPSKVLQIIEASKNLIGDADLELEVEYQTESTIGKFGLDFADGKFVLTPKETACLASDHCGIPTDKIKTKIGESIEKIACCSPDSGCC